MQKKYLKALEKWLDSLNITPDIMVGEFNDDEQYNDD